MNCLLFGSSGLIGTHLLSALCKTNTVITVGRHQEASCSIDLGHDWDAGTLPKAIDIVIYLAQSEKFREFPKTAESVFRVNTFGLLKALEYARQAGAKTFIYTSSGGVYGNSIEVCDEDSPVSPHGELGFYLGTKMCGEIIAENYTPYMNIIILRPFFVFGPGQRKDMLIPRLVERVKNEQSIQIVGEQGLLINPTYVDDAVSAIQHALELEGSYKINIGGPEALSMRQIGECIGKSLGKEVTFERIAGKPDKIIGSIEKMSRILWKPQVTFSEGIKHYIESLKGKGD